MSPSLALGIATCAGTLLNAGPQAESLASAATLKTRGERPATALRRIGVDLDEFRTTAHLDDVIVINVASSEPIASAGSRGLSAQELLQLLEHADRSPVPASVLYAVAALQSGCSYLNFTPSFGSDIPALEELALETRSLHMGRDGRSDLAAIGLLTSPAPPKTARVAICCGPLGRCSTCPACANASSDGDKRACSRHWPVFSSGRWVMAPPTLRARCGSCGGGSIAFPPNPARVGRMANERPAGRADRVRAYLQLMRFPAVFTALADIFLGFLLTHDTLAPVDQLRCWRSPRAASTWRAWCSTISSIGTSTPANDRDGRSPPAASPPPRQPRSGAA